MCYAVGGWFSSKSTKANVTRRGMIGLRLGKAWAFKREEFGTSPHTPGRLVPDHTRPTCMSRQGTFQPCGARLTPSDIRLVASVGLLSHCLDGGLRSHDSFHKAHALTAAAASSRVRHVAPRMRTCRCCRQRFWQSKRHVHSTPHSTVASGSKTHRHTWYPWGERSGERKAAAHTTHHAKVDSVQSTAYDIGMGTGRPVPQPALIGSPTWGHGHGGATGSGVLRHQSLLVLVPIPKVPILNPVVTHTRGYADKAESVEPNATTQPAPHTFSMIQVPLLEETRQVWKPRAAIRCYPAAPGRSKSCLCGVAMRRGTDTCQQQPSIIKPRIAGRRQQETTAVHAHRTHSTWTLRNTSLRRPLATSSSHM